MPLSEHEQRLLDEMERNLYRSEADVVSTSTSTGLRPNYRNIVWGSLLILLGIGGLVAGVITQFVLIGVLGFVAMFLGVFLALTRSDARPSASAGPAAADRRTTTGEDAADSSFSARMQRRWERRTGDSDR